MSEKETVGAARLHLVAPLLRLQIQLPRQDPDLMRCLQPHRQSPHLPCLESTPEVRGLPSMPCSLPRWTEQVLASVASLPVLPSPFLRRVVGFITRLRPNRFPGSAARKLPNLPTTSWVGPSPTGNLRRWGALRNPPQAIRRHDCRRCEQDCSLHLWGAGGFTRGG